MEVWQSFPANTLYACFGAVAWGAASLSHVFIAPRLTPNNIARPLLHTACVFASVLLLSAIPFGMMFAGFMYWHSWRNAPLTGDCTKFVSFKDPKMAARYKGKRIDMETLYEMYFDGELNFKTQKADHTCLLNDVLSRRDEFVKYTFGLTTHLRFMLFKWIPDVLSHSRFQDMEQVRDHYDMATNFLRPFSGDATEDNFFSMFLGKRMVYTSGIASSVLQNDGYPSISSQDSLETMQDSKLRLICNKLRLHKGDTHLDIGCGWGTLVNHSASRHGTIATGVTLSKNQVFFCS
jgi:hypothetical protein